MVREGHAQDDGPVFQGLDHFGLEAEIASPRRTTVRGPRFGTAGQKRKEQAEAQEKEAHGHLSSTVKAT